MLGEKGGGRKEEEKVLRVRSARSLGAFGARNVRSHV